MAVPKRNDRLIQHFMKSQKVDSAKSHSTSEETEFNSLKYDIDHGMKLPEHKMKRYNELKEKLKK